MEKKVAIWVYVILFLAFLGDRVGRSFFWSSFLNASGPFSLRLGNDFMTALMAVVLLVLVIGFIFYPRGRWALSVVFLAGLNNFIDRLLYGGVIDYWTVAWGHFNFSDVLIFLALAFFLFSLWQPKFLQRL